MTNLVIVESPAKCSKIQGFLGPGYKVIASMGHIRHLKEDLEAIGLDKDFEATWEFMRDKAKARQQIMDAGKTATKVYLAADDDREGELIAYSVCLLLRLDPATTARAVFHEITATAVKNAIANPRTLDMNKVSAAQARAILDMMIGFTMSPLLWKNIAPALSAGRCQTPALRLVVEKEDEIANFQSSSSWKIHGEWFAGSATTAMKWPAALTDELADEEDAQTYLQIHHDKPKGKVLTAETRPWTENAPLPLITSTLQQQASSLFGSAPKRTMQIAQRLYEAGHITYMRTDKAVLSEEAVEMAKVMVTQQYGAEFVAAGEAKKKVKKTKKAAEGQEGAKAQEAHEAIRPTHFDLVQLPETEDWNGMDRRMYHLIWLRAIQSVMAPVKGDQHTVTFVADGDDADDFQWRATWRKTNFLGWRKAATKDTTEEDAQAEQDTQEAQWAVGQALKPGTIVTWASLHADPHETKAPPRYSEANLIRELEQQGIGRPSTFASLVSTILEKNYVEVKSFEARPVDITKYHLEAHKQWPPTEEQTQQKVGAEKSRLTPTSLGRSVLNFLLAHFDDLFQYGFTAQMESRLDKIAEGEEAWKQVLRDTWTAYKERYQTLKTSAAKEGVQSHKRREFGENLVAVQTKKGPLLLREDPADKDKTVFYGWPAEATFESLSADSARAFADEAGKQKQGHVLGMHDGHPVTRKSGKFGLYAEWNGKTASCALTDSLETIVAKFTEADKKTLRVVGQFEIRQGPYGPYMFKHEIKGPNRKFVSVPPHVNLQEVNEAQLIAIFQHELQNKARSGQYGAQNGGGTNRGGGRGGWRGRGRGRGH